VLSLEGIYLAVAGGLCPEHRELIAIASVNHIIPIGRAAMMHPERLAIINTMPSWIAIISQGVGYKTIVVGILYRGIKH